MLNDVYLHSFKAVLPPHHRPQGELVDWLIKSHLRAGGEEMDGAKLKTYCLTEDQIAERYYECPDVDEDWDKHAIYRFFPGSPHGAGMHERSLLYAERASGVFGRFYPDNQGLPDHLIHVTCTGYVSPSPAQVHFGRTGHAPSITHAYHMGCYASLPAVRAGKAMVLGGEGRVDIVHTEMCSLHLQSSEHTPEQMVVQSLFADGHIRYTASETHDGPSFRIRAIHEKLVPESGSDMTWMPASHGMKMTLSRDVPFKIVEYLKPFLQELVQKANLSWDQIQRDAIFAVHPGGPKIIEGVQRMLKLSDAQVVFSKKVLLERGNMSSATLPHVWLEILDSRPALKTPVVSLAFGPGLTLFGGIFEVSA